MDRGCQREGGRAAAEEFARALNGGEEGEPDVAVSPIAQLRSTCSSLLGRAPLVVMSLGLLSFLLLLLLRPPFVVCFEYDQRRPWKGSQQLSWVSVVTVTLVATLVPLLAWLFLWRSPS